MIGYFQLIRPLNCFMTSIAVFIGGLVVAEGFGFLSGSSPEVPISIYLAMLAAFLIAGAGNSINDYIDVEADRINKPKRPIPAGKISKNSALAFSLVLFIAGIVLAGTINFITFIIAIANSIILVIYSTHLQNKILLGNISISYLVASSFLFGWAAVGSVSSLAIALVLMALSGFSNLSREIVKDIEDIEGDRKSFLKRLAYKIKSSIAERFGIKNRGVQLRYGKKNLKIIAGISLIVSVIVSPIPYILNIFGLSYLIILIPTDLVFLFSVYRLIKADKRKDFSRISKLIKSGMNLGLLAFVVGALALI